MDYHIEVKNSKNKWERIASFKHSIDRVDCLRFLADRYEDIFFRAVDGEE